MRDELVSTTPIRQYAIVGRRHLPAPPYGSRTRRFLSGPLCAARCRSAVSQAIDCPRRPDHRLPSRDVLRKKMRRDRRRLRCIDGEAAVEPTPRRPREHRDREAASAAYWRRSIAAGAASTKQRRRYSADATAGALNTGRKAVASRGATATARGELAPLFAAMRRRCVPRSIMPCEACARQYGAAAAPPTHALTASIYRAALAFRVGPATADQACPR